MTNIADFHEKPGRRVRIYSRIGKAVRTSKNLAGVMIHARDNPVNVIELRNLGTGYYGVAFHFDNGDSALTTWSDWRVVCDWIAARRSWSVNRISVESDLLNGARDRMIRVVENGTIVHGRAA